MPNTAEAYRQAAIIEFKNQLRAKLATQHVQREREVPIYGNATTFNLGELMYSNIMESRYFFKILDLVEFEDVIDEIKNVVHDLEPLVVGSSRHPSSAFCILYLLACKRLTFEEVTFMLHYMESPYVRAMGFLYLRFALNPRELWKFFAPYFDDAMKLTPFADKVPTAIGSFALSLIENKRYQSLMLPAIPVALKREWDVNILKLQALDARATSPAELHVGDSVMGFYGVDLKWYPAVIQKVLGDRFLVVYDGYGNREIRSRGHVLAKGEDPRDIRPREESPREESPERRSQRRGHEPTPEDFLDDRKLQAVARERERNAVVTSGRAATAVGHVKNSLMLRMDTFTNVKVEPEPERNVIVKTIDAADSVEKMRVEAERKKREEENRKRLEAIQKMYLKKTEDDAYNNDYV
ncbi:hypothetical protein WA588_005400, partial [Blastocystis sp. NMH]